MGRKPVKEPFTLILSIIMLLTLAACGGTVAENTPQNEPSPSSGAPRIQTTPDSESVTDNLSDEQRQAESDKGSMANISITVGDSVFTAKLYDNEAATVLLAQFPLTLGMSELNGNEKYYYLPHALPADSAQVENINAGDLMLYGSDCLVLFYKSFSTSYSYTRLGYIEDASGLAAALGSGSVDVSFTAGD